MKNLEAADCGCYRLIQLLVVVQQMVCFYLLNNYPIKGSPKWIRIFICSSTLLFAMIGICGAISAQLFDDSLLYLFIACLLSYAIIQTIVCNQLVKSYSTISDFHCVIFIVSCLMAGLTFNTMKTTHTFSDYKHRDQIWTFMSDNEE